MGIVTFRSFAPQFLAKNAAKIDAALDHQVQAIKITLQTVQTPLLSGDLRGSVVASHVGEHHFRVDMSSLPYASYQNRGMRKDGSHVVKNYTTPGTGPHFFEGAIEANKDIFLMDLYYGSNR